MAGGSVEVVVAYDDYAVWFRVLDAQAPAAATTLADAAPACTCLHHVFYSRERILQLNDGVRAATYADALAAVLASVPAGGAIASADDGILLPTLAAEAGWAAVDLPHLSGYAQRLFPALFRSVPRSLAPSLTPTDLAPTDVPHVKRCALDCVLQKPRVGWYDAHRPAQRRRPARRRAVRGPDGGAVLCQLSIEPAVAQRAALLVRERDKIGLGMDERWLLADC